MSFLVMGLFSPGLRGANPTGARPKKPSGGRTILSCRGTPSKAYHLPSNVGLHLTGSVAGLRGGPIGEATAGSVLWERTPMTAIQKRSLYWPPPRSDRSKRLTLPSGKKCFVFNAKRDQDGDLEPVVCFVDSQNNLLMWFNEEEFLEFEKLVPRLESYYELWEEKAANTRTKETIAAEAASDIPSIGLDG
ncbi:hypothetical protein BESB_047240 [Besnoitia besnoiti]|uniref:Uncharacterized protein n=1 Tax=Besnoitia besnoiti TaxID=94643 RepID=A0A2A9MM14_BESBE|nr:hypothetical protein BESB_047240 [Besnoitia besnoiti]PFH36532.1 hypothetical protein BESB_047240 [Besnoitia besnoiti]